MSDSNYNASIKGARCRSPSLRSLNRRIRVGTVIDLIKKVIGPEIYTVETASQATGSPTTKFHTENNRERRLMVSTL